MNSDVRFNSREVSVRPPARGKIFARPRSSPSPETTMAPMAGLHPLNLALDPGETRDGWIYVPDRVASVNAPAPLLVAFHGVGGEASGIIHPFKSLADETGFIILAIDSRKKTWDLVRGGFGEDLEFLNTGLEKVFAQYSIRSSHIAVGGFSDGASYALSVGLSNGNLFTHVMAFAPGFVAPFELDSPPRVFIAHGTEDRVLPIDRCSRRIVPHLQRAGFDLRYLEFNGGHGIPDLISREAVTWFLTPAADGVGFY